VADGALSEVGPATLLTTFSIATPGDRLPDFLYVVNNPGNYALIRLDFKSTKFGQCTDGRKARLSVYQVAASDSDEENVLVFSKETVEAVDLTGIDYKAIPTPPGIEIQ
jgi:hypothetical protein